MFSFGNNPQTGGAQFFSNHWGVPATFTIVSQATTAPSYSLPTDVPSLHSMINTLLELQATNTVNAHLAVCAARLQAQQKTSAPATASTTTNTTRTPTTAPLPCPDPGQPSTAASGRGAASPEVFQEMARTNWHGRLGRAHMVDVDALSGERLAELDSFLRQRLRACFPKGGPTNAPDQASVFAYLAAVGIRLEDRACYLGIETLKDEATKEDNIAKRARNLSAFYYANSSPATGDRYWYALAMETLVELARYRGLFDDEGFLKE